METIRICNLFSEREQFNLLALGCEKEFLSSQDFFAELDRFVAENANSYLFCCLSYDLKNKIEDLDSKHIDLVEFPEIVLWKAELVVKIEGEKFTVLEGKTSETFLKIIETFISTTEVKSLPKITFETQISEENYLQAVKDIKQEIQLGNVYELNFCQQYYAKDIPEFDSISLFQQLKKLTKAPFSAYLNLENHEVFCGSPERYIQKKDKKIISQPIKGTIQRGNTIEEDEFLKQKLKTDPKEKSENVMITDLVRNDFSRIATKNSVKVDELCGLYSFGTVHQLISTISCEIKEKFQFSDILKATFPMGSMTGAPKIAAMELSEKYESFKRGLYSGSIGYIKPGGDFDFNVVIRTLIKNKTKNILSASVGGAITIQSDPEKEFEECQVKIQKLLKLLNGN
ncbi:MAG: anthranilate synthase component I family protein [Flavobacteriia bacterium]|jgi:para-aminobenzoate synthetase component 1